MKLSFVAFCIFGLFLTIADAGRPRKQDRAAKAIIKKSTNVMQKSILLDKKVHQLKKKANHSMPPQKKEAILNMAASLNRLAKVQKKTAVKQAKKAIETSPLAAVKGLQALRKSTSNKKKLSATELARHIAGDKKKKGKK